jgi:hypothetical protein
MEYTEFIFTGQSLKSPNPNPPSAQQLIHPFLPSIPAFNEFISLSPQSIHSFQNAHCGKGEYSFLGSLFNFFQICGLKCLPIFCYFYSLPFSAHFLPNLRINNPPRNNPRRHKMPNWLLPKIQIQFGICVELHKGRTKSVKKNGRNKFNPIKNSQNVGPLN